MTDVIFSNEDIKNTTLSLRNIVKTDSGYELQPVYGVIDNKIKRIDNENKNDILNKCMFCYNSYYKHSDLFDDFCHCRIVDKLYDQEAYKITTSTIEYCQAFDEVMKLNKISSMDDMVKFISKSEVMFNCPESFEECWGFERKFDEETGDILETTEEYYKRGGEFQHIPRNFPCVIYFDYQKDDLVFDERYDCVY